MPKTVSSRLRLRAPPASIVAGGRRCQQTFGIWVNRRDGGYRPQFLEGQSHFAISQLKVLDTHRAQRHC